MLVFGNGIQFSIEKVGARHAAQQKRVVVTRNVLVLCLRETLKMRPEKHNAAQDNQSRNVQLFTQLVSRVNSQT